MSKPCVACTIVLLSLTIPCLLSTTLGYPWVDLLAKHRQRQKSEGPLKTFAAGNLEDERPKRPKAK